MSSEVVRTSTIARGRSISWLAGLDGLRALAVAAVVVFHFAPAALPGGFLGVDLFFVISGYLITRLLLAEIDRTGQISVRDFYRRRVRRLLPAVVVLIVVTATASALIWHDQLATMRGGLLASMFYVTNWWLIGDHQSYFVASGRPPMLQHLWSLAIEEQFYLIWPLVLVGLTGASVVGWSALTRRGRNRDGANGSDGPGGPMKLVVLSSGRLYRVVFGSAALAVASTVAMTVIAVRSDVPYGADSARVYFGTDTHTMGLLLGACAGALAQRGTLPMLRRKVLLRGAFLTDLAGVAALVVLVRIVTGVDEFTPWLYRGGFLAISALCTVLVAATARRGSLLGRALELAPLRWLGSRSYSIYLWHWPVAVVTRPGIDVQVRGFPLFALRVAATVLLAEASYRFIERPIRAGGLRALPRAWGWDRLSARARTRMAPALVFTSVVVVGSLISVFASGASHPALAAALVQATDAHTQPPAHPTSRASPGGPSGSGGTSGHARPAPRAITPTAPASGSHPSHRSRPATPRVSAFGDSVMLGAESDLWNRLPGARISAVEGRQARDIFADVSSQKAAGKLAPDVVIHTGNNGIVSPDDLSDALRGLSDRSRVVVLTDRVPRDWQDPNNDMIRRVVARFPNAVLVDWFHISDGHIDWFYSDGLHLREPGAAAYAAAVSAAVRG